MTFYSIPVCAAAAVAVELASLPAEKFTEVQMEVNKLSRFRRREQKATAPIQKATASFQATQNFSSMAEILKVEQM